MTISSAPVSTLLLQDDDDNHTSSHAAAVDNTPIDLIVPVPIKPIVSSLSMQYGKYNHYHSSVNNISIHH